MKKIILTGGGTAGHVNPNLALVPSLTERGFDIRYIGGKDGVERGLVTGAGLTYHGISAGKLRRYFKLKNFTDIFRVLRGIAEAFIYIRRYKPSVIFSKGGFVSVPVVVAGCMLRVPVIIHESDMTPGLANRLSFPFASVVCCSFPETLDKVPKKKAVLTGAPIRAELFTGDANEGRKLCGFTNDKPVVLVMGGSLGSARINETVRLALPALTESFNVAHICGGGNADNSVSATGYAQFEYVKEELKHLYAAASVVVSRAGANSLSELAALNKPALLIPLPLSQSRGDQILNAESYKKRGFFDVIKEEEMDAESLAAGVKRLYAERDAYIARMKKRAAADGKAAIVELIEKKAKYKYKTRKTIN